MSNTGQEQKVKSLPDRVRALSPFHRAKAIFMMAAFLSLALSVGLWATGERTQAIFVGLWVPSIHSLGTLVLTGERRERG